MGRLVSRMLAPMLARLGSRTIMTIGGTLFLLNMLIPDPVPLVDEFLILAGTILLSRLARGSEAETSAPEPTGAAGTPKHVGRGSTQPRS
jgi:Family of unknown function (DUF6116)